MKIKSRYGFKRLILILPKREVVLFRGQSDENNVYLIWRDKSNEARFLYVR